MSFVLNRPLVAQCQCNVSNFKSSLSLNATESFLMTKCSETGLANCKTKPSVRWSFSKRQLRKKCGFPWLWSRYEINVAVEGKQRCAFLKYYSYKTQFFDGSEAEMNIPLILQTELWYNKSHHRLRESQRKVPEEAEDQRLRTGSFLPLCREHRDGTLTHTHTRLSPVLLKRSNADSNNHRIEIAWVSLLAGNRCDKK